MEKKEWMEHLTKAVEGFVEELRGKTFPPETKTHIRSSLREMLLAFRSLIDAGVERIEKREKKQGKGEKVRKVEVR